MQSRERQRTAAVQGGLGEWGDRQRQPSDGRPGDDLRRRDGQQRRQGGQAAAEFGAHQRHGFGRNRRRGEQAGREMRRNIARRHRARLAGLGIDIPGAGRGNAHDAVFEHQGWDLIALRGESPAQRPRARLAPTHFRAIGRAPEGAAGRQDALD